MWIPAFVTYLGFILVVSDAIPMSEDVVTAASPYILFENEPVSTSVDIDPTRKVKFSCMVENSDPSPVLGWRLAGEPKPEDKHFIKRDRYPSETSYIVSEASFPTNLTHHKTKLECIASSEKHGNKTASVMLHIIHPSLEVKITSPHSLSLKEGDQIEMTCVATGGYPSPKYSWVREELPVNTSNPAKWVSIYTGQNYTIGKSKKDAGKYACVTHNLHPGSPLIQSEDVVIVSVNKAAMFVISNQVIFWTLFVTAFQLFLTKM